MFSSNTSQVSSNALFIEDVFSTTLYTGNGSTQTINNGIDLAGKGGLVWTKSRSNTYWHEQTDTVRGPSVYLSSNSTNAQNSSQPNHVTAFNSNGFSVGNELDVNANGVPFASWTFRKQPKFFDVVTWTGDNTNNRAINHSLGGTVGCLIVKKTSGTGDWPVWHRSLPAYGANPQSKSTLYLNATLGGDADVYFGSTAPTSTAFYVDVAANASGSTYVAYLFAHNAGGFGLTGTDNVISCGSYTGTGAADNTVTLGFEPQWVLVKQAAGTNADVNNWIIQDVMRGFVANASGGAYLFPNMSSAESAGNIGLRPTATGFATNGGGSSINGNGGTYIYIAIRRGPMKTPTSGTSVYQGIARTGTGANATITTGFVTDLAIGTKRSVAGSSYKATVDRLRGTSPVLFTNTTDADSASTDMITGFDSNTGYKVGADTTYGYFNESSASLVSWNFRRAPGFFDEVCYMGTSTSVETFNHNLGVAPEMMVVKRRSAAQDWVVYHKDLGITKYLVLNGTGAVQNDVGGGIWGNTSPTATQFSVGDNSESGISGSTYVNYLFASCPGVSKCTAFTGTGALQTIDCGFTGGARFVLIKRTDSTGDWYVWDSSRGLSSSNDPYLLLNSTAAEVTSTNWVDTTSTGFQVTAASGNNVNINGASYIALAIS